MAQENNNNEVLELSEILQVRRDKLKDLQSSGNDPFQITKLSRRRTHNRSSRRTKADCCKNFSPGWSNCYRCRKNYVKTRYG